MFLLINASHRSSWSMTLLYHSCHFFMSSNVEFMVVNMCMMSFKVGSLPTISPLLDELPSCHFSSALFARLRQPCLPEEVLFRGPRIQLDVSTSMQQVPKVENEKEQSYHDTVCSVAWSQNSLMHGGLEKCPFQHETNEYWHKLSTNRPESKR